MNLTEWMFVSHRFQNTLVVTRFFSDAPNISPESVRQQAGPWFSRHRVKDARQIKLVHSVA
jgi:hypothetical protein